MKTVDQQRAAKIFEQVGAVAEGSRQKYGSMSHKLPVLVRTAGLVQALAFVEARGEKPHHQLLDDLAEAIGIEGGRSALLKQSREAALDEYMYLTQQVLQALLWYKRFAQSVLDVQTTESDDTSSERRRSEEEVMADAGTA